MKKVVSIVLICGLLITIGATSIFATIINPTATINDTINLATGVNLYIAGYSSDPYLSNYNYIATQTNLSTISGTNGNTSTQLVSILVKDDTYCVCTDTQIGIRVINNNDYPVQLSHNRISGSFEITHAVTQPANTVDGFYIHDFSENTLAYINFSGNSLICYPSYQFQYNNTVFIPAHGSWSAYFTITEIRTGFNYKAGNASTETTAPPVTPTSAVTSFTVNSITFTKQFPTGASQSSSAISYSADVNSRLILESEQEIYSKISDIYTSIGSIADDVNWIENYTYFINQKMTSINSNVQTIIDAYTAQSSNAQELTSDVSSNDSKLDTIHQNEAQWYSQNSQAIESTGLSNFEFSTDQTSALTGVFSLFQRLWTALGDYTFVITFTLMMSFATFFLRHSPTKPTQGNNYSKKGGNNGSST